MESLKDEGEPHCARTSKKNKKRKENKNVPEGDIIRGVYQRPISQTQGESCYFNSPSASVVSFSCGPLYSDGLVHLSDSTHHLLVGLLLVFGNLVDVGINEKKWLGLSLLHHHEKETKLQYLVDNHSGGRAFREGCLSEVSP